VVTLEMATTVLPISVSQVARIIGVSHRLVPSFLTRFFFARQVHYHLSHSANPLTKFLYPTLLLAQCQVYSVCLMTSYGSPNGLSKCPTSQVGVGGGGELASCLHEWLW
jgi:hypothetical protein